MRSSNIEAARLRAMNSDTSDHLATLLRTLIKDAVREALHELEGELRRAVAATVSATRGKDASTDEDDLLSVDEVARRLNVERRTIREWIRHGYLPAVRLGPAGRRYGVRRRDVRALIENRHTEQKAMDTNALAIQIVRAARNRARHGVE